MSHDHHDAVMTPAPPGFKPHKVAHHFDSIEQEFQASKFGFWLFLVTEVLLFAGLFLCYFIFHGLYPDTFRIGGQNLNWVLGALNTVILLTSSWTMAMGVRAAQLSKKREMLTNLIVTVALGGAFMVDKYFEYTAKIEHGLLPGALWHPHGEYAAAFAGVPAPNMFFALYFTMTGIHGLHVLVGMGLITWMIVRGFKNHFHSGYYMPVELIGLYWHIVDLIWIFLFPLLYLVP